MPKLETPNSVKTTIQLKTYNKVQVSESINDSLFLISQLITHMTTMKEKILETMINCLKKNGSMKSREWDNVFGEEAFELGFYKNKEFCLNTPNLGWMRETLKSRGLITNNARYPKDKNTIWNLV